MSKIYKYKTMNGNKLTVWFRIREALMLLLLSMVLFSCVKDIDDYNFVPVDEATVTLTITAPGATLPRNATRSLNVSEHEISDIRILVFTDESGEYRFKYMVEGEHIQPDGNNPLKTNFTAKLKTSDDPIKLVLVANSKESFEIYTPAVNATEDVVRKNIVKKFDADSFKNIPMFGSIILPSLDAKEINKEEITMLRAVARVDVVVDLDMDYSNPFIIEEAFIYRANDNIQTVPDITALTSSETLRVNSPSVPSNAVKHSSYSKRVENPFDEFIEKLYLPESSHYIDLEDQHKQSTCVVVGGYYNGSGTLSYYRIDFNSGLEGHPLGQVLRNHRYEFTVKQVNGSGWDTLGEAAQNRSTTIIAEIKTWEDFTMEMYANGDNYMGIDSRNLKLGHKEGLQKVIGVQSTVPYRISWVDGDGTSTGIGGIAVNNQYFSAQIVNYTDDTDDLSHIVIKTLSNNNTSQYRNSQLKVEWMNWIFYVNVTQSYYDVSVTRAINVLTAHMGSTGSLGSIFDPLGSSGRPLRLILSNEDNFSPRGTVDGFAGFFFNLSQSEAILRDANGTNDYSLQARMMIGAADVIFLANDNNLSLYSAGLLIAWLESSPNKVLIVGCDGDKTSPGLILPNKNGLLADQFDWRFNLGVLTDNYKRQIQTGGTKYFYPVSYDNPETAPFFHGSFGDVPQSTPFRCVDLYFGHSVALHNKDIIPLLKHENSPDGQMSLGVDKKRRIIYHGDGSLHQQGTDRLSLPAYYSGIVSSAQDIFFANMWEWIVQQVLWGDEVN